MAESYPFLVNECKKRKLEVMAHGTTARRPLHSGMTPEAERAYIKESIGAVTKAMGKAPTGWIGPNFAETMNTPNLLASEGIHYVCDWANDEQPYKMKVQQGELFSVGVDYDLDDVYIHWDGKRTIDEYRQIMVDNFDGLYKDGAKSGRLMVDQRPPLGDRLAVAEQVSRQGAWRTSASSRTCGRPAPRKSSTGTRRTETSSRCTAAGIGNAVSRAQVARLRPVRLVSDATNDSSGPVDGRIPCERSVGPITCSD